MRSLVWHGLVAMQLGARCGLQRQTAGVSTAGRRGTSNVRDNPCSGLAAAVGSHLFPPPSAFTGKPSVGPLPVTCTLTLCEYTPMQQGLLRHPDTVICPDLPGPDLPGLWTSGILPSLQSVAFVALECVCYITSNS
eukprot:365932-Chlamydomonas_euryale.AAC.14